MFATPLTSFDLPSYAAELAHLLAKASSPPLICTRPFNKLVMDYVDKEAVEGKDGDRLSC